MKKPVSSLSLFAGLDEAQLPSYQTAAETLERKNGAGWRLLYWTAMRGAFIALPVKVAGATWKQALVGAGLASGLISLFVLARLQMQKDEEE